MGLSGVDGIPGKNGEKGSNGDQGDMGQRVSFYKIILFIHIHAIHFYF